MNKNHTDLLNGIEARDPRSIARAMSLAESGASKDRDLMAEIYKRAGRAHTIGITGVPGSGKSTMVRALAQKFRASDRTVGIVAVDPSSPFSGGAILGDRVRMGELSGDDGVFIRSMATRGSLGGLTRGCMETVDILDASGFDVILIETVGVGQDEVDIARAALSVLVVSAPGLGDDIQAIKAGILEIADIHVVSKCDRPDSNKTISELKGMLSIGLSGRNRHGASGGWSPSVMPTSAQTGQGIEELVSMLDEHLAHLDQSGERTARQAEIAEMRVLKAAEDIARNRVNEAHDSVKEGAFKSVHDRTIDPHTAALNLMSSE